MMWKRRKSKWVGVGVLLGVGLGGGVVYGFGRVEVKERVGDYGGGVERKKEGKEKWGLMVGER